VESSSKQVISEIIQHLQLEFEILSRPADYFVGFLINRDRKNRYLHLSQPTYINKLLTRFSMQDCRPKSTPADPGTRLIHNTAPTKESSNQELFPYQEAVGSLQYCIITTRPDISCVVGQVAQFSNNPGKAQCEAVKRILAYLKGTVTHGICFKGAKINGTLSAFSDADYAGDLTSRRSTTASC
jgi:hypothetical protein